MVVQALAQAGFEPVAEGLARICITMI
jgi:hypothetical protein